MKQSMSSARVGIERCSEQRRIDSAAGDDALRARNVRSPTGRRSYKSVECLRAAELLVFCSTLLLLFLDSSSSLDSLFRESFTPAVPSFPCVLNPVLCT